ncbi:MAG TPA: hypothetical protein VK727_15620 [Steroidobacteraceae bacterium]|nr:hypothetical protein [Steroidobacteraceae bacterium]
MTPKNPNLAGTHPFGLVALGCLVLAFWMLLHPYRGLEHDSVLYAVLALARLHPAALGHDLFVRYGTQDGYTVFSPLFAAAIRAVGLERAAAIMTFATHVAFFGAAWLLARRLMSASLALLAVGLLAVLPAWYGSNSVFATVEAFLTPRQSAEAFALAGLTAALCSRQLLAGVCMVVALLLHPIIAAAGVTAWIILIPGLARPRPAVTITVVVALVLMALSATGIGPFKHFDGPWLSILKDRLSYLFPTLWRATEWISTEVHAAVLVVGIGFSRNDQVRRLCLAALLAVVLGMLFAIVESDGLHVVIAAQLQTWRWLWLLGVLSALLLPTIAVDCWQSGDLGRAAALSLLGALLIHSNAAAAVPALLACVAALASARIREPLPTRIFLVAAVALLALSLVVLVQDIPNLLPELKTIRSDPRPYMVRIGEAQALAYGGLLPAAALTLVCFALQRATRRSAVLLCGLGTALLLSVLPYSVQAWTHAKYPADRVQAFAPWRAAIPESAEVLWPDPPPAEWFELGRSSYWSLYQMAGMVFSRDVTMVSTGRETAVTPMLAMLGRTLTTAHHYASAPKLKDAQPSGFTPCQQPGINFFASWTDLGPTPYPAVAPDTEKPQEMLHLYRCGEVPH